LRRHGGDETDNYDLEIRGAQSAVGSEPFMEALLMFMITPISAVLRNSGT